MDRAEFRRLKELLGRKQVADFRNSLKNVTENTNPNYALLKRAVDEQKYEFIDGKFELVSGFRGVALEGSSRSGKTWSGVDLIIYICLFVEKACTINIYRETYNEFKTTLYEDFKRRLDDFGLPNKFHGAEEVKSFKIGDNKIFFLGDGKHGGGCDYAFYNEAMFLKQSVFDQSEMRCRKFWWADYNPSVTEHWFFDSVLNRPDVAFLRTTFQHNPHISPQERAKIMSYEPWEPGSYVVEGDMILYKGKEVTETYQPPPHPENVPNGTADEFMWKVYGLGLRGAMKGVIIKHVTYIDEFPTHLAHTWGMDLGFTVDPTAIVKHAEDAHNIYFELRWYAPTETPDELDLALQAAGVSKRDVITCDSSDRYTSQTKGTFEMVRELYEMGYEIAKVSKTQSIMFWLMSMKRKKIHIVKNNMVHHFRKEVQNYRMKEVNGIMINQPVDGYDHAISAGRYSHMAHAFNEQWD